MTPDQVRKEIKDLLGSIGLDTAPWAQQLLKSANSKNIDISEWNTFILKVAEVAASASTLQRISELLAMDLDTNIRDGDYEKAPGAVYQKSSDALSPYTAALGQSCIAGGKGFAIKKILLEDGTVISKTEWVPLSDASVIGYELKSDDGIDGISEGDKYSVRLGSASYFCGTYDNSERKYVPGVIDRIEGKRVYVTHAPQIVTFNGNTGPFDVLMIVGKPYLGDTFLGDGASTEGCSTLAHEEGAHAEGTSTLALGKNAHSEGRGTVAGYDAHSEGQHTYALGDASHSEGKSTVAVGLASHSEGELTYAVEKAHSEGIRTSATGIASHAEGRGTIASGAQAHAEGNATTASHSNSHAAGNGTKTGRKDQTVVGAFNKGLANTFLEVGNGTSTNPSNAFEVYEDGRAAVGADPREDLDVVTYRALRNSIVNGIQVALNTAGTSNLTFDTSSGTYAICTGVLSDKISTTTDVTIPATYQGLPVTQLKEAAFQGNTYIETVKISDNITTIPKRCFYECTSLTKVIFSNTLTNIGLYAFQNCTALNVLVLPKTLKTINNYAFSGAPLDRVEIPEFVALIGKYTFSGAKTVIFKNYCTSIDALALQNCTVFVPWDASKNPSGAPWSATSVYYNCTPYSSELVPDSPSIEVVQTPGESTAAVMSQNAVSKELEALDNNLIGIWSDLEPRIAALEDSTPDSISTSVPLYRHCLDIHFNGELDTFSDTVELRMFCSIISSYGAPFEDLTDDPEYAIGAQTHPATGCVISGGVCSPIVYFKGAHHPDGTGLGHVLIGCVRHKEFDGGAIGIQELTVHPYNFAEYTDTVVDTNVEI